MSRVWVNQYIERSGIIASFPAPSHQSAFNSCDPRERQYRFIQQLSSVIVSTDMIAIQQYDSICDFELYHVQPDSESLSQLRRHPTHYTLQHPTRFLSRSSRSSFFFSAFRRHGLASRYRNIVSKTANTAQSIPVDKDRT